MHKFEKEVKLTERQLRTFDQMWMSNEYTTKTIGQRFGIAHPTVLRIAKQRNLPSRTELLQNQRAKDLV